MGATGVMAFTQLATGASQASAINDEGDYQKSIFDINARFAEVNAKDAIKRGDKEAIALKKQAKRLIGSQRASLAAQGVDIETGSALDIQEDTAVLAQDDVMTIKNNAWKEALGYRVEAFNFRNQGKFAKLSARNKARNTLLTSGLQALSTSEGGGA
jgi:hypothetical protein